MRPGKCLPLPDTLQAIAGADLITLGPGSLYTSVIPNLLVEGMPEAIRRSPAVKAYFVKAKGVLLELTFHGGNAPAQKDKLIALVKAAAAAL